MSYLHLMAVVLVLILTRQTFPNRVSLLYLGIRFRVQTRPASWHLTLMTLTIIQR